MDKDKLIYISVYKLEEDAVNAINKLHAQGFRQDQISVLAYNTERFNTLFRSDMTKAALPDEMDDKVSTGDVPDAVEDALTPDMIAPGGTGFAGGIGFTSGQHMATAGGYVPMVGLAGLNLSQDNILAHERNLKNGDILVILQADEGQEYRPDLPLTDK